MSGRRQSLINTECGCDLRKRHLRVGPTPYDPDSEVRAVPA